MSNDESESLYHVYTRSICHKDYLGTGKLSSIDDDFLTDLLREGKNLIRQCQKESIIKMTKKS